MTWAMAIPQINRDTNHCDCTGGHCSNHVVASCVCALLVSILITIRQRVPSTMSYFPKRLDTGKSCVICQDTSHKATLPGQARRPCLSEEWPVTGGRRVKMIHVALSHAPSQDPADHH